jgi:hypothetical protein
MGEALSSMECSSPLASAISSDLRPRSIRRIAQGSSVGLVHQADQFGQDPAHRHVPATAYDGLGSGVHVIDPAIHVRGDDALPHGIQGSASQTTTRFPRGLQLMHGTRPDDRTQLAAVHRAAHIERTDLHPLCPVLGIQYLDGDDVPGRATASRSPLQIMTQGLALLRVDVFLQTGTA